MVEVALVAEVSRTPLTVLRKGICGPIQESLALTSVPVTDVRHRRFNFYEGHVVHVVLLLLCIIFITVVFLCLLARDDAFILFKVLCLKWFNWAGFLKVIWKTLHPSDWTQNLLRY